MVKNNKVRVLEEQVQRIHEQSQEQQQ
jgi:hypothetical protein